mmetsp:Transcript_53289/g.119607  ORF Transcript_53289/g.119607 Transcript_53289/m.119607 type:complete len:215 (+) Transcript_53289:485-1129(+)
MQRERLALERRVRRRDVLGGSGAARRGARAASVGTSGDGISALRLVRAERLARAGESEGRGVSSGVFSVRKGQRVRAAMAAVVGQRLRLVRDGALPAFASHCAIGILRVLLVSLARKQLLDLDCTQLVHKLLLQITRSALLYLHQLLHLPLQRVRAQLVHATDDFIRHRQVTRRRVFFDIEKPPRCPRSAARRWARASSQGTCTLRTTAGTTAA